MPTGFFTHPDCLLHEMGAWHPESPARLQAIEDQLIASRIEPFLRCETAPLVEMATLRRTHTDAYIDQLQAMSPTEGYAWLDPDTAMNPHTLRAAFCAAGAAVAATDAVIAGRVENAFCSIRPPGHHAAAEHAMGFCFFNNVAVAVRHAVAAHGLQRVAIIDFDVHHGNGTESIFAHDPQVLMCGFFQHPFYPYSGADHPAPNMVNVPVPAYSKPAVIREAVQDIWLPRLHAFRPEMVFISAGFDAHREDDMASLALVEDDYAWLTAQACEIAALYARGRIVSCLEGGYSLSALGRSVVAHLKVLAGI